jgi:HlyD family secretion protein
MAPGQSRAVLRDIETLFDTGTASGMSDRQLLERFANGRDASAEAAFEVLALRHGPMVLRVCRNVLRNSADAEDAFQATFLVLVRRRRSIRRLESVGGWLNGVACRVAARARVLAARRRAVERRASLRIVAAVEDSETDESGLVVQEEVRRLPGKYRDVVVLCYLEGLTQEQAAVELGCPLGTVRSRLARARDLLCRRLTRRGLAPPALVVATAVARTWRTACASDALARSASVPPRLVFSTIRAAAQLAAGKATVAGGLVATLVQRTLWSMTMSKISALVASVALLGLVGYGAGVAASKGQDAPERSKGGKKSTPRRQQQTTASSSMVLSAIDGKTSILFIVPHGSTVKKGDLVCELDSAALWDMLTNQMITTEAAKAHFGNATLERESTEKDEAAYVNDLLPREKREAQAEVQVADAELVLAEGQLNATKDTGGNNELRIKQDELAIARAKLAREKANNRLHILERYTQEKRTKQLRLDVTKAHSNELAKEAAWQLEKGKAEKLRHQAASCRITAPRAGTLVYANPPAGQDAIGEGAIVIGRQLLFQIFGPADAGQ